jgi:hypothetical protein
MSSMAGFALALVATGLETTAHLIAIPTPGTDADAIGAEVERRLESLTIDTAVSAGASPVPASPKRLVVAFTLRGTATDAGVADAQIGIAPAQLPDAANLFATLLQGCRLTNAT